MKTKLFSIFALLMLFVASISINSCSKKETNCLNGGVFVDDQCHCPEGYTGSTCNTQVTPKKIRISTITIRDFPAYNGNEYWDPGYSGYYSYERRPDIYFNILKDTIPIFNMLSFHGAVYNAENEYDIPIIVTYLDITDLNSQYTIELWDRDSYNETDDLMLSLNFTPYSSTGGFPSTLYVEGPWGNVIFELEVLYVW